MPAGPCQTVWPGFPDSGVFPKARVACTDAYRCHDAGIHVPDAVFDVLQPHFSQREIVELTVTIGSYNLVSRFPEALAVDPGPAGT